jgi:hypothetical protein
MSLAGVSVRRVEDITEALWGVAVDSVGPEQKIYRTNEDWRNLPIEAEHPHIYLDAIMLKRGEVRNARCRSRSASTKTVIG